MRLAVVDGVWQRAGNRGVTRMSDDTRGREQRRDPGSAWHGTLTFEQSMLATGESQGAAGRRDGAWYPDAAPFGYEVELESGPGRGAD
jgi:hypothetical protein